MSDFIHTRVTKYGEFANPCTRCVNRGHECFPHTGLPADFQGACFECASIHKKCDGKCNILTDTSFGNR
jgi:hypothetical protein